MPLAACDSDDARRPLLLLTFMMMIREGFGGFVNTDGGDSIAEAPDEVMVLMTRLLGVAKVMLMGRNTMCS